MNAYPVLAILILAFLAPNSYSHAGCIKPAGDVYVQLSTSPVIPVANKQESFLFSFANQSGLVPDISGNITIIRNDESVLEQSFRTKDGIYGLKHTFNEPGVYEVYMEFSHGSKHYVPDDFVIEVIENSKKTDKFNSTNVLFLLLGIAVGLISSKISSKMIRRGK